MATIFREIPIEVEPEFAWDALRDVGALATRLVCGFVVECKLDGDSRVVRFANGVTATERIVTVDDGARRICWSASGGRMSHHNASAQVFAAGPGRCRVVWIADLLPNEMAPAIAAMIEAGGAAMQRTLESAAAG